MKNIYLLLSIFLLFAFPRTTFSQGTNENLIYDSIKEAKAEGVNFNRINSIFTQVSPLNLLPDRFIQTDQVDYLDFRPQNIKELTSAITFTLPFQNREIELELLEVPETFYDYIVMTSDGKTTPANREIKHYRGIIKDDPKSIVAISFLKDEIMGIIANDEGNFNIAKEEHSNLYILYNDKNVKQIPILECHTKDEGYPDYKKEVLFEKDKNAILSNQKCIKIYFETEHDVFLNKGSVSNVEGFVSGLFNQIAMLYQNENITIGLSEIYVWTTVDPYTGIDTDQTLKQFQTYRTSFNGDLGHLVTFRNIGGGVAAGFEGICNPLVKQRLAVGGIYDYYNNIPNYSWSVFLITHELGHLFGSRHTQACVWNGNNTAIDGCAATEGGCPLPGLPSSGGTIMSYCHNVPSVGINFNLGFGIQPGNVIRNKVATATCLCECAPKKITGPPVVCSSENFSINGMPTGTSIVWSASPTGKVTITGSGSFITVTKVPGATGTVTLNADVTTACFGIVRVSKVITLWAGAPIITPINYTYNLNSYPLLEHYTVANNEVTDLWATVHALFDVQGAASSSLIQVFATNPYEGWSSSEPDVNGMYNLYFEFWDYNEINVFRATATNSCETASKEFAFYSWPANPFFKIVLVPGDSILTVSVKDSSPHTQSRVGEEKRKPQISKIELIDSDKKIVKEKSFDIDTEKATLPISDLSEGTYILNIYDKNRIIKDKITIQH